MSTKFEKYVYTVADVARPYILNGRDTDVDPVKHLEKSFPVANPPVEAMVKSLCDFIPGCWHGAFSAEVSDTLGLRPRVTPLK